MQVGTRKIGGDSEPFIIAEMSGNHNGSLNRALEIIRAAAENGADAIKFQSYRADTITLDCDRPDFIISDPKSLWNGRKLYELYDEAHTPWEWHEALFAEARKHNIIPFSSPFDETAVDLLESLGAELYKIASFEITHLPLVARVAKTGKPMIISTGMATESEIHEAIAVACQNGAPSITILKCTSAYPADPKDINLAAIPDMRKKFGVDVGFSDHTLGIGVPVASVAYGVRIIEKHFTLDRKDGGVDSQFSMDPAELKLLKAETTKAWQAQGRVEYGGTENEQGSKNFRTSVWPMRDIKAGEIFTKDNLKIRRPGMSLAPKSYEEMLGKPASRDLVKGEWLTLEDAK